jgi:hypothetical protein
MTAIDPIKDCTATVDRDFNLVVDSQSIAGAA